MFLSDNSSDLVIDGYDGLANNTNNTIIIKYFFLKLWFSSFYPKWSWTHFHLDVWIFFYFATSLRYVSSDSREIQFELHQD